MEVTENRFPAPRFGFMEKLLGPWWRGEGLGLVRKGTLVDLKEINPAIYFLSLQFFWNSKGTGLDGLAWLGFGWAGDLFLKLNKNKRGGREMSFGECMHRRIVVQSTFLTWIMLAWYGRISTFDYWVNYLFWGLINWIWILLPIHLIFFKKISWNKSYIL
jgi:hypothetical protein